MVKKKMEKRGWLSEDDPNFGRPCQYGLVGGTVCGKPAVYQSVSGGANYGFACAEHAPDLEKADIANYVA